MRNKTVTRLILYVVLLCCLTQTVSANSPLETELIDITSGEDRFESMISPDGIYPFIYDGTEPYISVDIDTSMCTVGRLYVYNQAADTVIEVFNGSVLLYNETKDYLYFVAENQMLCRSDYENFEVEPLYQSESGTLKALASYFNIIYFVENDYIIRSIDTVTGTTGAIAFNKAVASIFALSGSELLITAKSDGYYVYDIVEGEVVQSVNESQAINLMNQAMEPDGTSGNQADASIMSVFSPYNATQSNDVSLPLSQYPVPTSDNEIYEGYNFQQPISWFHNNGQEGCGSSNCKRYGGSSECEGFGRYAHDAYLHITDYSNENPSAWLSSKHYSSIDFEDNPSKIIDFFESLNTGAYIRYITVKDPSYTYGDHSAVFLYTEGNGVWVYECNQKYDEDPNHGCGIQARFYYYTTIKGHYQQVLHYVNHSFTDDEVYYNSTYHNVGCSQCDGYVRQTHSGDYNYTYLNASQHVKRTACCSGNSLTETHSAASITLKSSAQHARYYSCCKRSVNEGHSTWASYSYTAESETHHRVSRSCCSGYYTEEHVFDGMNTCIQCGIIYYSMRPVES